MEYAFLKFNDELKVNINGLGLVPAISLYPELWQLYLDQLTVRADYLSEVLKGMKGQENDAESLEHMVSAYNARIRNKTLTLGLSPVIAVQKIGETEKDAIVRNLVTNEVLYVAKPTFKRNITNEFDIMRYRKMGGIK